MTDGYRTIRWIVLLIFLSGCGGGFAESLVANTVAGVVSSIVANKIEELVEKNDEGRFDPTREKNRKSN